MLDQDKLQSDWDCQHLSEDCLTLLCKTMDQIRGTQGSISQTDMNTCSMTEAHQMYLVNMLLSFVLHN